MSRPPTRASSVWDRRTAAWALPEPHTAGLCLAIAGGLALGAAEASQHLGDLVPCALCLLERWPWRAVVVIGLVGAAVPPRAGRWILGLGLLALLASIAAALVHVGVEQGLWKSPLPECAAPHISGSTFAARLASMPLRPSKPCDAPTYLIPDLKLSMAAMNLIWSVVVFAALGAYLTLAVRRRA